ncbi:hypothetical protein [Parasitella parasitica]|uniref:DUF155 domain-containing protein n=1 Tax=Parasitella parasitica TaxID=35722 RepID=A0A0B7NKG8_9FUNG|nr:hypothetical protein [Parasitella parasitica]
MSQASKKPSAISKQVLKTNPIPQNVQATTSSSSNLTNSLNALHDKSKGKPTQPLRSTKVSQKLVLFPQSTADEPETSMLSTLPVDANLDNSSINAARYEAYAAADVDAAPAELRRMSATSFDEHQQQQWQDEQRQPRTAGVPLPIEWTFGSRTQAERMTKDERELALLPRAAAYCTGDGYDLARLRPFLRQHHRVAPRLYDECLYAAYHFPLRTLRPDKDNLHNIRVRSNVPLQAPGSRGRHNDAVAHNNEDDEDEMDYDEDHLQEAGAPVISPPHRPGHQTYADEEYYPNHKDFYEEEEDEARLQREQQQRLHEEFRKQQNDSPKPVHPATPGEQEGIFDNPFADQDGKRDSEIPEQEHHEHEEQEQAEKQPPPPSASASPPPPPREIFKGGEVFIFDYGVVVFWNFRRAEELLMLEDFMQFSIDPFRDNPDEDMQIEEIHFQYDTSQMKPRIFNDMITLKSSNHMIKLTLSHGLSQSAVVARYEDIMDKTIEDTKHLPKEMAETGRLGKTRAEITKINGQLFTLRMNVNLVSNVLDTPEIFWSEPALQPMYTAIREYLEIPQRAQILNDRLRVISDLLSMLRDHLTNFGVEYQTLIIIYLIIVAVIVACFEIGVKILQSIDVL